LTCAVAFQSISANETPERAKVNAASISTATGSVSEPPFVLAIADPEQAASVKPQTSKAVPVVPNATWTAAPARFFTINEVLAKRGRATTPAVQLAAIDPKDQVSDTERLKIPAMRGEEPFGLYAFKAPEGLLWTKWRKVEGEIQAAAPALSRCRAEPAQCTPGAARFVAIVKLAEARRGQARLKLVNEKVNDAIRYTSDSVQWGVADLWSAPIDVNHKGSFDTGLGDCEDYAIAKYVALREAGVPAKDLRVLLVRDNVVRLGHAVLAARDDGRWLIMDNRFSQLLEENDARFLSPLFALDNEGVKLFAAPYTQQNDQAVIVGAAAVIPERR
jgi:predicted transglutaminase-like cysteine proteinase